jgi:ABC-type amino acid transport substrate-binding protein
VWILISLFLCSLFTGYISSVMTAERLADRPTNLGMLNESIVLAVDGSASAAFLDAFGLSFMPLRTLDDALEMFMDGAADAVVGDQVLLEYNVGSRGFSIWPLSQRPQLYGIALPEGSPLTEAVNRSILLRTQ